MSFDSSDIMITLGPMSRTFARATSGASAAVGVAAPMTTISIAEIHPHSQPQTQPLVGLEGFAIAATLLVFALSTQLRRRLRGRSGLVRAVPERYFPETLICFAADAGSQPRTSLGSSTQTIRISGAALSEFCTAARYTIDARFDGDNIRLPTSLHNTQVIPGDC